MELAEVLNQAAKPAAATKPKKNGMPVLNPGGEVAAKVDERQEAKSIMKQAEAVMKAADDVIIAYVRQQQDTDGFNSNYHNSYAVQGIHAQAKVVYKNSFSINAEDEARLAEILGDAFPQLIEKQFTVKLRPEVMENKKLGRELVALLGNRFHEFLEVTESLKVAEDFSKNIYRVVDQVNLSLLRTFARQYRPSVL